MDLNDELSPIYEGSPSWRWDFVKALIQENRKPSRMVEKSIGDAYKFLKRWRTATEVDRYLLKRDYPELFSAYLLYANPQSEKWLLEAGLLSDADDATIGQFAGHKPATVKLYGELFYDVREKRSAKGYIANQILVPAVQRGMDGRDFDFCLKALAYFGGWKVLTDFVSEGAMSEETRHFFSENFMDQMLKLGFKATHRLEANNFTSVQIIEMCVKLRELEQTRTGPLTHSETWGIMESLLKKCGTTVTQGQAITVGVEPRVLENTNGKVLSYGDKIPVTAGEDHGQAE
jgi:hypothetical protein